MSHQSDRPPAPRAVIHKQILDVAAAEPDAAIEAIARDIPGATPDLVERVFNEYGDPGQPPTPSEVNAPMSTPADQPQDDEQPPEYTPITDLSPGQRETLQAIHEHPEATQREIAELLDVSTSTVSNRLNQIDGFDWHDRQRFTDSILGEADPEPADNPGDTDVDDDTATDSDEATVAELVDRVVTIEEDLAALADGTRPTPLVDDPALVHKILRACMADETITEDEELRIVRALLG